MSKSLSLLLAAAIGTALGMSSSLVRAQANPVAIKPLIGAWEYPGTLLRFRIEADGVVFNSKIGVGDIQHENASYFRILYREHSISCRYDVRRYSETEVGFVSAEPQGRMECDLGILRRSPEAAVQLPGQAEPNAPRNDGTATKPTSAPPRASLSVFRDCPTCPDLVVVPSGQFTMGSMDKELGRFEVEGPLRNVSIGKALAVGRYAITRDEFMAFLAASSHVVGRGCRAERAGRFVDVPELSLQSPGFAQDGTHPVVCISYTDATAYVDWLSKSTGKSYRLLTEAEREYSARSGTTTAYWWGDVISTADARYGDSTPAVPLAEVAGAKAQPKAIPGAKRKAVKTDTPAPSPTARPLPVIGTAPVNSFRPNLFGLFQMHGNVAEWTQDCWNRTYVGGPTDGSASSIGDCQRGVVRGGAWSYSARALRSAFREPAARDHRYVHVGFRIARDLVDGQ